MAASKFEALVDEAVSGGNTSDEDAGPQRFSGMRRVAAVAVLGGALVVAVWGHGAGFRTPTVNEKAVQEQVGLGDIQGALNNAAEQVTGLAAPHVETLKHHAGSAQAAASKHIEAAKNLVAKNSGAAGSALQPITDAASKQVDAAKAAFGAGGSGATCGGLPCSAGTCCGVMCCSGGCDSSGMVCKLPGMNGATDKLAAQASTAADFDSVKNTAEQQYNNAKNVAQQQIDKAKNTMDQMNGAAAWCRALLESAVARSVASTVATPWAALASSTTIPAIAACFRASRGLAVAPATSCAARTVATAAASSAREWASGGGQGPKIPALVALTARSVRPG
eukprot:CAMPEP_0176069670 /NCGR_PEP_ID=MMETSP0120_2-20121206/34787_1 /TAXON_ID=160619 /ORGANISM="Kryptoperidinium foliaceum, Strain CCMP 1326" /LENGTH=335 /DNA_ID=CAMNT_0017403307 /DNA_START=71 /DNA_END=1075 /DNA_ORIENTATION=-